MKMVRNIKTLPPTTFWVKSTLKANCGGKSGVSLRTEFFRSYLMRALLRRYLFEAFKIFPTRPQAGSYEAYEVALAGASDTALEQALKRCLVECKYFPTPAEIRERLPEASFPATTSTSDCPRCGGCGWDVTERDEHVYRCAIPCVCRKNRPAKVN